MGSSGPRSLNDSCSKAQCGWGPHCVPRGFPAVCGSLRQIDLLPNQRHSCHDSSFWTFHKLQYLCPYHTKVWVIQPMWQGSLYHNLGQCVCGAIYLFIFFQPRFCWNVNMSSSQWMRRLRARVGYAISKPKDGILSYLFIFKFFY